MSAITIYVDADGCPVKDETYRVARRHGVAVVVVANGWMRVPEVAWVRFELVAAGPDAADDWIVQHAVAGDVAVTADILLAARLIANGVRVIDPRGQEFTEDQIGDVLAKREILAFMRETGAYTGGPKPLAARDRSRFLATLHEVVLHALRGRRVE